MLKIDKKDRRLLLSLDRNSRAPLNQLSKRLSMPIETVRYRIQKLTKSGVIKNFLTVIDGGKLGFYYYKVFVRFHNVTEQKVQQIVRELMADSRICWVVRVDGNYDIGFTPRVTNPVEQSNLLDNLREKYSAYIRRWTLSVNIKMNFFARDFIVGSASRKSALGSYSASQKRVELDESSQAVLQALAENPRSSAAEISRGLHMSSDTVLDRLRLLEQKEVVVRHTLVTDTKLLGQVSVYVLIYLNHVDRKREEEFRTFCGSQPNIVYLVKALGEWDYEISVEAETLEDYRNLMMCMNTEFSNIIQEYNGLVVRDVVKYVYP